MKAQWLIKGVWLSRVPLGTRGNKPPLLTMSGFNANKRLKSHLQLLEVLILMYIDVLKAMKNFLCLNGYFGPICVGLSCI